MMRHPSLNGALLRGGQASPLPTLRQAGEEGAALSEIAQTAKAPGRASVQMLSHDGNAIRCKVPLLCEKSLRLRNAEGFQSEVSAPFRNRPHREVAQ
jgi:hypothetical protein